MIQDIQSIGFTEGQHNFFIIKYHIIITFKVGMPVPFMKFLFLNCHVVLDSRPPYRVNATQTENMSSVSCDIILFIPLYNILLQLRQDIFLLHLQSMSFKKHLKRSLQQLLKFNIIHCNDCKHWCYRISSPKSQQKSEIVLYFLLNVESINSDDTHNLNWNIQNELTNSHGIYNSYNHYSSVWHLQWKADTDWDCVVLNFVYRIRREKDSKSEKKIYRKGSFHLLNTHFWVMYYSDPLL